MAKNPDISALGAFAGKYEQALFSKFYNSFDVANDVTLIPNVKSKMQMTKLKINNGPKPYTGVFASKGNDIQFLPRELEVEKAQRDIIIEPEKYRGTFMGEMRGRGENAKNKTIPFAQYTWEQVLGELAANINDRTAFFGRKKSDFAAFSAGTAYAVGALVVFNTGAENEYFKCITATLAGESPNTHPAKWQNMNSEAVTEGYGKKITDAIALGAGAGGLDPVVTGAITSASGAYAQFTKVWRALPDAIKNRGANIYTSFTDLEYLTDDFEEKVSKFTETDNGIIYLSKTNKRCRIVPATWMSGTRRLIATPKSNILMGTDELSDMNSIATEEHVYHLDAGITFVIGFQIRDFESMKVSDQA